MKFDLPFQENDYRKLNKAFFDYCYQKHLNENKKLLIFSITFLLFGLVIIYGKSDLGYLFWVISSFGFFGFVRNRNIYKSNEKKFLDIQNEHIKNYLNQDNPKDTFEISDDYFYYCNGEIDLKLKWEIFSVCKKIKEDVLLIQTYKHLNFNFLISPEGIGLENFNKIIVFLESKIQKNGTL